MPIVSVDTKKRTHEPIPRKVYISGAISGKPNGNKEAFYDASIHIIRNGSYPINPHDVCAHVAPRSHWSTYMKECIKALCEADSIYMLRGWIFSRGARVEWLLAKILGMEVEYE